MTRLPITLSPEEGGKVEAEVRREVLLLEAARARDEALEAETRGDYEGGKRALRRVMEHLEEKAEDDDTLDEELRDLSIMEERMRHGELSASDVKYMKSRARHSHRSRMSAKDAIRRTKE